MWVARYDGPASGVGNDVDRARALAVSPEGSRVYVTGISKHGNATGTSDYTTIAYDAQTGQELWITRYNGPEDGPDSGDVLDVSPDGSLVYVSGQSWNGIRVDADYATVAYDATTGDEVWVARYDGPANATTDRDIVRALSASPDGAHVYVTGYSITNTTEEDYLTIAYDAVTGQKAWVARHDGGARDTDWPRDMTVSPDSSLVYVTGSTDGFDNDVEATASEPTFFTLEHGYATTIAYDAITGEQAWLARYDGPPSAGGDEGQGVAVSPDGSRVYVTGGSYGTGTVWDFVTLSYDADTGNQSWVARYDGTAHDTDYPLALGVSPDGSRVFTTGQSKGTGTSSTEFATVAYDADRGDLSQLPCVGTASLVVVPWVDEPTAGACL